jgi:hypothetical protein
LGLWWGLEEGFSRFQEPLRVIRDYRAARHSKICPLVEIK